MTGVLHPAPLDRHQTNGFQRPMIETAPVASHVDDIPAGVAKYNRNVVLITDGLVMKSGDLTWCVALRGIRRMALASSRR
jgi:hypothetical protein